MEQLKMFEEFLGLKVGDRIVIREEYKAELEEEIIFEDYFDFDVDSIFTITEVTKYVLSSGIDYETNFGITLYSYEVERWNS